MLVRSVLFSVFALLVPLLFGVPTIRIVVAVISFGAEVFCNRIPGLTHQQKEMCKSSPDAMVAIGDGIRLATTECRYQFRHNRWNCTGIDNPSSFGHVVRVGSKEAAFTYAISSAGVAFAITAACARGNISNCGCAPSPKYKKPSPAAFKWAGCSVDINYGLKFARKFMDARELEKDERSLMNLHNNKAGRKAVKQHLQIDCKCHGVSGSCTMKTCWKTLPSFRIIGDDLMKKYHRAREVISAPTSPGPRDINNPKKPRKYNLVVKKFKMKKLPKKCDLVYLHKSPNYCDFGEGSLGTAGRTCNRTSREMDGCDLMCCGRGYNTHQYTRRFECHCKFIWCCDVKCEMCNEKTEEYTCK